MRVSFHKDARSQFYDQEGVPLTAEQVQDFVTKAYAKIGVVFSGEELKSEASGWYVGVDDNDPDKFHWFFAYKNTPFGRKFFAMGHDGTPAAKKELLEWRRSSFINDETHPWSEASGRVADIFESWGIPKVPFEIAQRILPGKQLEQVDEFSYKRKLTGAGGMAVVKTVYGYPQAAMATHASLGKGVAKRASKETMLDHIEGKDIEEKVSRLMERRSFGLDKEGPGWAVYTRNDEIWLKVVFKDDKVVKTYMYNEQPEGTSEPAEVRQGPEGLCSFTNTFGD
jgi:hypothetical protein